MSKVVLQAPFAGWLTPLEEVPDPVFAEHMMGEGLAIDPIENLLRAPADASVISIPKTAHAVTLRLANGAELLIHIGLETVALGGKGFRALTNAGAAVKAGDPLIELDLSDVARGARSLVTPIVVASEGFTLSLESLSRKIAFGDPIGTVSGSADQPAEAIPDEAYQRTIRIDAAHGLHARPAARIAAAAKQSGAEVRITHGEASANARSIVALMGLGIRSGDEIGIIARGLHGRTALDTIVALIESGLGEDQAGSAVPAQHRRTGPICASPGLAVGTVVQLRTVDLPVARDGAGVAEERERLDEALAIVSASLGGVGTVAAELIGAHRELLEDPQLLAHANGQIAEGRSAGFAWRSACGFARTSIRATGDPLLIERAADLLDLERRVIAVLAGDCASVPELPHDAIIVAPDLLPSEFLSLDKEQVAGICTAEGGPTSHVAILAAAAGIPMLVAAGNHVLDIAGGTTAILSADQCILEADPPPARLEEANASIAQVRERRSKEVRAAQDICFTADGVRIEIFANIASVADAEIAVIAGAEGCGLFRTEFIFLGRDAPPNEEEQARVYGAIAAALGDRPLIVRTIDIGADKPVPYLGVAAEENPALGLRGVRLSLARPELFQAQLRAILRAVPSGQCRIMLPMIADLSELRDARAALETAKKAVRLKDDVPLGIMIETPASAMLADKLAQEADFLSIGTNDLTQYALAADRTNAAVSAMLDAFHPAVLRLIRMTAEGAAKHERMLGVCGGLASDPLAAPLLIGLGVSELSVAPAAVPAVKAAVRRVRMDQCRDLAASACAAGSAQEARAIVKQALQ
jgi:multiphosphoryl transfer protein